ncbi:elongation factor G-like protein [Halanaerobium saccharolyticum]|uniref:Elongation factor G-like protein n=1 Tax=Halanaerobium saccharolyticum TaxID=43595 RepID=A0A4R6LXR9_9FIRM|nr:hypothetical protein [Halanaerobium saccharolyticum]TDO92209.1 elongation factor G-like protein [Halanaerobium saccharolyticum]
MIRKREIFIAGAGLALNDQGIKEFFDQLVLLTDSVYLNQQDQKLQALLYKISHDQDNNRISHIKVLNGSFKVRDLLEYHKLDKIISEKITKLRIYNGQDYHNVNQVNVMGTIQLEILKSLIKERFKFEIDFAQPDIIYKETINDQVSEYGHFEPPDILGDQAVIKGQAPAAAFMNYPIELRTFSGGKGIINLKFGGYDFCHNSKQVIKESNYDKHQDPEYFSSSIFCSKGKGYTVPWNQAETEMHCL